MVATRNGTSPKTKPQKIPNRTVVADDLVITVDGVDYYPHAGESVTFRLRTWNMADYLYDLKRMGLQAEIDAAIAARTLQFEQSKELVSLLEEGRDQMASYFVSWTWTDPEGVPYASPPTAAILNTLSTEEIVWLQRTLAGNGSGADQKNSPGDSTDS